MKTTSISAALALVLLALPAEAARPAEGDRDPADPFPRQEFQGLPQRVVGVLVSGAQEVLALEGRRGPAEAYCLGSGPSSYRWLYVPVRANWIIGGLNVPVGPHGDTVKGFTHLSMANPKTVERWGVHGPYALVEVEVNGGLGAPPGDSMVATHLRVVDGSKQYPLQVSRVVAEMRRKFQVYLKEQEDAIAEGMREARGKRPPGHKLAPGREQTETLFVTWLRDSDQLRVVLRARITKKAVPTSKPPAPPQQVLVHDDERPPPPPVHCGVEVGVELGMTYEVSKQGLLDAARPVPLRVVRKELFAPASTAAHVAAR
jgi:hypothetical protein